MFGKMSNSKWHKLFEEIEGCEIVIRSKKLADEHIIHIGEITDHCLFAYDYPGNRVDYTTILYVKIACDPERASEILRIGQMDRAYEDGVLTISAY